MSSDTAKTARLTRLRAALPSEHGFWVMLGGALASALLRAGATPASLMATAAAVVGIVALAVVSHRRIRRSSPAQLAATLLLSLSAVPVEFAGGVPSSSIASAAVARAIVFMASTLVVRAAFARSKRGGSRHNAFLHLLSVAIAGCGALSFYVGNRGKESAACALAALVCVAFAYQRPTVKELKFLGLSLSGLVLASALTLAL